MADDRFPDLLTTREAAKVRRCTREHLANERHRGEGPPTARIGGRVYYPAAELKKFIEDRIMPPAARRAG